MLLKRPSNTPRWCREEDNGTKKPDPLFDCTRPWSMRTSKHQTTKRRIMHAGHLHGNGRDCRQCGPVDPLFRLRCGGIRGLQDLVTNERQTVRFYSFFPTIFRYYVCAHVVLETSDPTILWNRSRPPVSPSTF